ncbi:response regulator transcription factor [Subtercola endophyticus]|uniref:response regulator transcription factor n=1 Tax=Subtercola endophyticus TaxID=2895559 RepID=UPI001E47AAD2|nr:response regulator transcription factor [Subtercola endophyticus]UFS59548.1 response regulator transcription factor [Subtercola endophyticus]
MRVLVVEDEADLAAALKVGLGAEGYTVDVCRDGLAAVQFALDGEYAAIILDLMIPHQSGYSVISQLRTLGLDTPILVLTAKSGVLDQTEALDTGADDYLTKPFLFPVLLARLRALVRRASPASSTREVGDLVIDPVNRTCLRGDTPISLTPLEFGIVEILARTPHEPVSKSRLLALLWPAQEPDPNVLEARILSLRRKIDTPFGRHSLDTVRGHGYRLIADRPARD